MAMLSIFTVNNLRNLDHDENLCETYVKVPNPSVLVRNGTVDNMHRQYAS